MLFREQSGEVSQAQFHAFTDTWNWADAAAAYQEFVDTCENHVVVDMIESLHGYLKSSPMMAYLAMMAPRLVELHRILKPTGSLYLHCDPTASHYLRMILDGIFGGENFRNEIIWKRTTAKALMKKRLPSNHDIILAYQKTAEAFWNDAAIYQPYDVDNLPEKTQKKYSHRDPDGRIYRLDNLINPNPNRPNLTYEFLGITRVWRWTKERMEEAHKSGIVVQTKPGTVPQMKRYLDEQEGIPLDDVWVDIAPLNSQATERQGYPTQKPQSLLERIISMSSKPGDVVLDPFCGCGTTVHAAQKLGRQWIGIDVTYIAINLIKVRLKDAFGDDIQISERGQPTDFEGAKALAELPGDGKFQFQQWAMSLIEARPLKEGDGKGADRGVDGFLRFKEYAKASSGSKPSKDREPISRKILVQVKGGHVGRGDVVQLLGDVNNQKFSAGVFITLESPTKPMKIEAADAGNYTVNLLDESKTYPKIQILTVEGLMNKTERLNAPPLARAFGKSEREAILEKQQELV